MVENALRIGRRIAMLPWNEALRGRIHHETAAQMLINASSRMEVVLVGSKWRLPNPITDGTRSPLGPSIISLFVFIPGKMRTRHHIVPGWVIEVRKFHNLVAPVLHISRLQSLEL